MTRRILLHVGSPKCGSTYLQQVMLQNRDRLERARIRYPHDGSGHPGNAGDLAELDAARLAAHFDGGIETLILSHEDLYSLSKRGDALAGLAREQGIEVQLIAFLRPFSEFIYGDYSQFMKQFFDTFLAERRPYGGRDFEGFAQRRIDTMKPAAYLRQWQGRFPQTPLILESHRNIRQVITALLGAELVDSLDWQVDPNRVNRSLRMQDCDSIAAAMRDPGVEAEEIKQMFRDAFHQVAESDPGKTAERTEWIETRFAPQNATLLAEFGFDNRHPAHRG
ncbi:hypothetical protein ACFSUD_18010 [Sulfitobacter aestuarii]|uniref:Sulfotransferase domain-containing protein n=1 Tax=Sulfitobacter aestuarii TaxID=2161676 RepID=A0ABW5U934_9RHOB